jgi:putative YhbY family RNA-binding protein
MLDIPPQQRRALRARAHHLDPVVSIGLHGATPQVINEIDRALAAHELVKVRVHNDDRDERERLLVQVCDRLACAPVQHLGKLLILWRPAEDEPAKNRPRKMAKPAARPGERAPLRIAERASKRQAGSEPAAERGAGVPRSSRRRRGMHAPPVQPPAIKRSRTGESRSRGIGETNATSTGSRRKRSATGPQQAPRGSRRHDEGRDTTMRPHASKHQAAPELARRRRRRSGS